MEKGSMRKKTKEKRVPEGARRDIQVGLVAMEPAYSSSVSSSSVEG
jgi:hypothetical protein